MFNLDDYNFELPYELIAQKPYSARGLSRLLVSSSRNRLIDSSISDLSEYLPSKSLIVFNETRVIPARIPILYGNGAKGEVLLLEKQDEIGCKWSAIGRPQAKLIQQGRCVTARNGVPLAILPEPKGGNGFLVELPLSPTLVLDQFLRENGQIPLPPYIKRDYLGAEGRSDAEELSQHFEDENYYQTIFAKEGFSVAAPTAGLHFSEKNLDDLKAAGHELAYVNLQVGAGTFLPVTADDIRDHRMHEEKFVLGQETFKALERAHQEKRSIVCVGTTTFRTIESFYLKTEHLSFGDQYCEAAKVHSTGLFVYPKEIDSLYIPRRMDALLTNFHQPKSTLLMLVMALFGRSRMLEVYSHAIASQYQFFSYGDASLLVR